jgi:copper(I)-binding protein
MIRMRPMSRAAAALPTLALLAIAAACHGAATGPSPIVEGAWVRTVTRPRIPPAGGVSSAAYMTLRNHGTATARLVGATCPDADTIQIHQSTIVDGIARMRPVEALPVPPDSAVRLAPGGYHLMLLRVHRSLLRGDTVNITLHFAQAPDIKLRVPVQ